MSRALYGLAFTAAVVAGSVTGGVMVVWVALQLFTAAATAFVWIESHTLASAAVLGVFLASVLVISAAAPKLRGAHG